MPHRESAAGRFARMTFAALAALAAVAGVAVVVYALINPPPKRDFQPRFSETMVIGAATNATENLSVKVDRTTDLMVFGGTVLLGALMLILAALCLLIAVLLRTQSMLLHAQRAPGPSSIGGGGGGGGTTSSPTELSTQSETG